MEVATLNKWMFGADSCGEVALIHICKEVIQRKKSVVPGEEKLQRVRVESNTFIRASASLYFPH